MPGKLTDTKIKSNPEKNSKDKFISNKKKIRNGHLNLHLPWCFSFLVSGFGLYL